MLSFLTKPWRGALTAALTLATLCAFASGGGSRSSSSSSSSSSSRSSSSSSSSRSSSPSSSSSSNRSSGYGSFSTSKPSSSPSYATPSYNSPAPAKSTSTQSSGYGWFGRSAQPAAISPLASRTGGAEKPTSQTTSTPTAATPQTQSAWARVQQAKDASTASRESLKAYKNPPPPPPAREQVGSFFHGTVNPGTASPSGTTSTSRPRVTYTTYVEHRQVFYQGWSRPSYAYSYRPYYGAWDSDFMWRVLGTAALYDIYFHHRHDSDWVMWRHDLEDRARQDEAVAARMRHMDDRIRELEAQKVVENPNYMPEGMDPAIAMAPAVAETALPKEPEPTQEVSAPSENPEADGHALLILLGVFAVGALLMLSFNLIGRRPKIKRPFEL